MCLLQHQLILKFRPRVAEAMCELKDKIIYLQDQLVKKKDEEIEQLKSLADRVETTVGVAADQVQKIRQAPLTSNSRFGKLCRRYCKRTTSR